MSDGSDVVERARAFLAAHVTPRLAAGEMPWYDAALKARAAEAGLFGISVPVPWGGAGGTYVDKMRVTEVLAGADFGLAMAIVNSHNAADNLARNAQPEVAARYVGEIVAGRMEGCTALTEPGAGSDFASIATTAVREGDAWVLNGAKAWIIHAQRTGVVVLYAQTRPGSGAAGIASFVVDGNRAGFVRGTLMSSALPALGTGAFRLVNYRAAASEMLAPPGEAFKRALNSINGARIYIGAMCCGMVAECLRTASAFGRERRTFGKPLHEHQAWRHTLADAAVDLEAARLMVHAAADRLVAGADVQGAAARAKVFATGMAHRHIGALLHAMGAEGLSDRHPFRRHLESVQAAMFTDGSTEMLKERIAREL